MSEDYTGNSITGTELDREELYKSVPWLCWGASPGLWYRLMKYVLKIASPRAVNVCKACKVLRDKINFRAFFKKRSEKIIIDNGILINCKWWNRAWVNVDLRGKNRNTLWDQSKPTWSPCKHQIVSHLMQDFGGHLHDRYSALSKFTNNIMIISWYSIYMLMKRNCPKLWRTNVAIWGYHSFPDTSLACQGRQLPL